MAKDTTSPSRFQDSPRDKPQVDRTEHANLDRPGAQAHPRARAGWELHGAPARTWRAPGACSRR